MGSLKIIRSAARAVVICDGKLLVTRMRDRRGIYYILPGGGQLAGETLIQTIQRECMEEVGILVKAVRLLYVREYIGKNHNFSRRHHAFHQVEHVFLCEAEDPASACPGSETDNHQVGVSWLALDQLHNIRFYPEALRPFLADGDLRFPDVYMGDCN
jgi:8-oxo-dGTP pyrophosphatase MutT (NUDIX family)